MENRDQFVAEKKEVNIIKQLSSLESKADKIHFSIRKFIPAFTSQLKTSASQKQASVMFVCFYVFTKNVYLLYYFL